MKFDMSRAWNDAVAMVSANREVMLIVAGVFFLLPSLATSFFFSDVQAEIMARASEVMQGGSSPEALEAGIWPAGSGVFMLVAFVASLAQMTGFLALLALLDDKVKLTVGEALLGGLKCLPTLIATVLIFVAGYIVVSLVLGIVAAAVGAAIGSTAVAAVLVLGILVAVAYAATKLSLTMPVVVIEGVLNPFKALMRSWQLTKGNSVRLFVFYLLLMITYLVISLLVYGILITALGSALGTGTIALLLVGLVSGAIGMVVNMVFTGILAAIHRQLAGPSLDRMAETFE